MKKLQESNEEAAERFDKALTKLSERKMKYEMAIHQVSQHTDVCTHKTQLRTRQTMNDEALCILQCPFYA